MPLNITKAGHLGDKALLLFGDIGSPLSWFRSISLLTNLETAGEKIISDISS